MQISVPKGFSESLPFTITDGPTPTEDDVTALFSITSTDDTSVRLVYPDPTPGVSNSVRSVRVDALAGSGANINGTFKSPLDGAIHNMSALVTVTAPPNNGSAGFGAPSAPFLTPST